MKQSQISINRLAKELGVARSTVYRNVDQGMPRHSIEAARQWCREFIEPKTNSKPNQQRSQAEQLQRFGLRTLPSTWTQPQHLVAVLARLWDVVDFYELLDDDVNVNEIHQAIRYAMQLVPPEQQGIMDLLIPEQVQSNLFDRCTGPAMHALEDLEEITEQDLWRVIVQG